MPRVSGEPLVSLLPRGTVYLADNGARRLREEQPHSAGWLTQQQSLLTYKPLSVRGEQTLLTSRSFRTRVKSANVAGRPGPPPLLFRRDNFSKRGTALLKAASRPSPCCIPHQPTTHCEPHSQPFQCVRRA